MDNEYLTIKEFAKKLGMHHNTIRRAIKNNRIQTIRVGKSENSRYRIHISEIRRMAEFDLEEIIEIEVTKRIEQRNKL